MSGSHHPSPPSGRKGGRTLHNMLKATSAPAGTVLPALKSMYWEEADSANFAAHDGHCAADRLIGSAGGKASDVGAANFVCRSSTRISLRRGVQVGHKRLSGRQRAKVKEATKTNPLSPAITDGGKVQTRSPTPELPSSLAPLSQLATVVDSKGPFQTSQGDDKSCGEGSHLNDAERATQCLVMLQQHSASEPVGLDPNMVNFKYIASDVDSLDSENKIDEKRVQSLPGRASLPSGGFRAKTSSTKLDPGVQDQAKKQTRTQKTGAAFFKGVTRSWPMPTKRETVRVSSGWQVLATEQTCGIVVPSVGSNLR